MTVPLALFPQWIIEQYDLMHHPLNRKVHLELRHAVWGLPRVGILAKKQLRWKLDPFRYHECLNVPGLCYHETCPISFTLMGNNFGVKYINDNDFKHLIASLKTMYKLTEDWTGDLYCGIALDWDYINRTVDITMPGYIQKKLVSNWMQKCPYLPEPKKFGSKAQAPLPPNDTPKLDAKGIKYVQKIVRSILYYVLMALSSIAIKQTKATEKQCADAYNCLVTLPPMKWQR
jgi:hypothetical protein